MDDRVAEFHRLHETGCFVMPNPWDVGSARVLEQLGFPALATTSAGFAWTRGLRTPGSGSRTCSTTSASSPQPSGCR